MKNTQFSWGIVIVAFNPDLIKFIPKIRSFEKETANLVIINNGEDLDNKFEKSRLINLHKNMGIAAAQNMGAEILKKRNVDFLFFLDQDSDVNSNYFDSMLKEWFILKREDSRIGLLSPQVIDKNFHVNQNILKFNKKKMRKTNFKVESSSVIADTLPISSGILLPTTIFFEIGGLNSSLFIDSVDFDLDLKIKNYGYTIYTTKNASIMHSVGKKSARSFLGRKIYPTNHPIFRIYYMSRNNIYLYRKYGKDFEWLGWFVFRNLVVQMIFVLYEDNKLKRYKSIIKGVLDGFRFSLS